MACRPGFTLIEAMITVAIVGILVAIAYPSYLKQIQKVHRSAAQSWLMELATKEQQFYTDTRSYATDLMTPDLMTRWPPPTEAGQFYSFTATESPGPPAGFTLTATPIAGSSQVGDGTLTLASDGTKTPADKW